MCYQPRRKAGGEEGVDGRIYDGRRIWGVGKMQIRKVGFGKVRLDVVIWIRDLSARVGKFGRGVVAVREFLTSRSGRGRIRRTDRSNVGERNCAGKGGRSRWWGEWRRSKAHLPTRGCNGSVRFSSNGRSWVTTRSWSKGWMEKDHEPRSTRDRGPIIARS